MYYVNENKDAKAHFAFFFNFSRFLGSYWSQCFQILCTPSGRPRYYVNENKDAKAHLPSFSFFPSVTPI